MVAFHAPLGAVTSTVSPDRVTEQRRAERRGRRHGSRPAERRDLDGHRLAALVLDLDDRADADLVAGRLLDDLRQVEPRAQCADLRLEEALLVLRGVVLEVLGEVAELARLLDRGDDLGAARALELFELEPQRLGLLRGEPRRLPLRAAAAA